MESGLSILGLFHLFSNTQIKRMSELSPTSGLLSNMENGTFLEPYPTSLSTSVDSSSGHMSNVYVYVSIFLSLLAFLLLLLIIALQRLKNIISSSSSYPEYTSDAGSSFTNLEVCSISSQRSTFSNLSSWKEVKGNMLGKEQLGVTFLGKLCMQYLPWRTIKHKRGNS